MASTRRCARRASRSRRPTSATATSSRSCAPAAGRWAASSPVTSSRWASTRRESGLRPRLGRLMCGIVGYVGKRPVQDVLLEGLRKLEYRGYDSAGISVINGNRIDSVRAVGNLSHLDDALAGRAEGGVAVATRP